MAARIVFAHNDPSFSAQVVTTLTRAGYGPAVFTDSMAALFALETAEKTELLITAICFAPGKPHGLSLARMARLRRRDLRVLFVDRADLKAHVEGMGHFMVYPVAMPELLAAVTHLLGD